MLRTEIARRSVLTTARLSQRLGLGGGSTVGGRVGLLLDPDLLASLGRGRPISLVSGTNGKTTTTRLLVHALGYGAAAATSAAGANMPAGLVTALAAAPPGQPGVLEVDEGYLPRCLEALSPRLVLLLNLSRDQLDRVSEVRMVAARWQAALAGKNAEVVANADDPLVVFAAAKAEHVHWAAVGNPWHLDAFHCPVCGATIVFSNDPGGGWACSCGFARPEPAARLVGHDLVLGAEAFPLELALPGRFNRANAAMAVLGAHVLGTDVGEALARVAGVEEVAGRYAVLDAGGTSVRLLLAKNPAGWSELLALVDGDDVGVVVAINARHADGHDPSWLWDVPFEVLAGRDVTASGERRHDLAVRLLHAGVACRLGEEEPALSLPPGGIGRVDFIGNYTAFQDLRRALGRVARRLPRPTAELALRPARPVVGEPRLSAVTSNGLGGRRQRASRLSVVVVHPDLLGTYGDSGNGRVVANRALWRDLEVELVWAPSDAPLPESGDVYCLGGGEDGPQVRSAVRLRDGGLQRAVAGGAAVFAVCAGYQILGESFPGADGEAVAGAGLIEVTTRRGSGPRCVGELVVEPGANVAPGLGTLTGFENHAGHTLLGPSVSPLGRVTYGRGNGEGGVDGAVAGRVLGTYLHGPALARNPALADLLISLATGSAPGPLDDGAEEALRAERLRAVGRAARRGPVRVRVAK